MILRIVTVDTPARRSEFYQLKRSIYASDPFAIPSEDSFPQEGTAWLAYEGDRPVARCCARLQTAEPTIGTIGSFEAYNHPAAAQALLSTAVDWLKQQGVKRIIGPMDGDTWHHYRFTTGPFDSPPFIKEPWNPAYYPQLWELSGFSMLETYDSFIVDDPAQAAIHQLKHLERCRRNGYSFTPITAANYNDQLSLIYTLSCAIFAQNILYTPIDKNAFDLLYKPARPLLKNGLCWVAKGPNNNPAGFIFAFPDYADALRAMKGKHDILAKLRFLFNRNKATRTCIKTIGIIPEARGHGLANALACLCFENTMRLGFHQALMCLMHSANPSRRLGGNMDRPYRSYTLYEFKS